MKIDLHCDGRRPCSSAECELFHAHSKIRNFGADNGIPSSIHCKAQSYDDGFERTEEVWNHDPLNERSNYANNCNTLLKKERERIRKLESRNQFSDYYSDKAELSTTASSLFTLEIDSCSFSDASSITCFLVDEDDDYDCAETADTSAYFSIGQESTETIEDLINEVERILAAKSNHSERTKKFKKSMRSSSHSSENRLLSRADERRKKKRRKKKGKKSGSNDLVKTKYDKYGTPPPRRPHRSPPRRPYSISPLRLCSSKSPQPRRQAI